jgi:hypothetical protein
VFGDVSFATGAFFDVELGGLTAGNEYDKLAINGAAALGGTLNVSLINSFTPAAGNNFEILSATGGINGTTFAINVLPSLPPGLSWQVAYSTNSVVLTAALSGDFNLDNRVDAADYVFWRNNIGTQTAYNAWRSHFGQAAASGAILNSVPEPRAWIMLGVGGAMLLAGRIPVAILVQSVAARM